MQAFLDTAGGIWFEGDHEQSGECYVFCSKYAWRAGGHRSLYVSDHVSLGAIVVAPGYTDKAIAEAGGNPYGTTATVDGEGNVPDSVLPAVAHQTKRVLDVASWIKAGKG